MEGSRSVECCVCVLLCLLCCYVCVSVRTLNCSLPSPRRLFSPAASQIWLGLRRGALNQVSSPLNQGSASSTLKLDERHLGS
jgi:hypothetical protein